jgi:hypothetical protein
MIKSLKRNDIRYTPFAANKFWNAQNQRFEDLISWQSGGLSGSLLLTFFDYGDGTKMSEISSAFSSAIAYQQQNADFLKFKIGKEITGSTFYPVGDKFYNSDTNPVNIDESYQSLVYNSKKHLYYNESENPTENFGLESLDPSNVNRTIPKQISVFTVPLNKMGEKIQPTSVEIKHDLPIGYTTIIDDGNNNLKVSGSSFASIQTADYNCVSASILHDKLTQTYNGFQRSASVSTIPSNLSVSTVYNGSSVAPTSAGTYTVFSEISDGYYCGTKTDIFTINKIQASLIVTSVSNMYDGNRHDVLVATTPPGLNYDVVYKKNNLSEADPINVGTYMATVTINDQNYFGTSTGGTSTITAPVSNISFNNITDLTYGDVWEITPIVKDINNKHIKLSITSGNELAKIKNIPGKQTIDLNPSKVATSLGSVSVTADTDPSSTPVSRTFTISPKKINLNGVVSAINRNYQAANTSVNINNKKLSSKFDLGIIADDILFVDITGPSTGTISDDSSGTKKTVTFTSYALTGTNSPKYELIQPPITVEIFNNISLIRTDRTFDGNFYFISDFQHLSNLPNSFTVDWYKLGNKIASENYINKVKTDFEGNFPKDVGIYQLTITDNSNGVGASPNQSFTVQIIQNNVSSITLQNPDKFYNQFKNDIILFKDKTNTVKSFEDEISSPVVSYISFKDRNNVTNNHYKYNDLVKFSFISGSPAVEYSFPTIKPTVSGVYKLITKIENQNLYYNDNNPSWKIGDFIYIIVKDVNETSPLSDVLESNTVSSTYNLRKYFDPYTLSTWTTVAKSSANLIKDKFTNYLNQYNKNYLGINLTGAGGGSLKFNNYTSTDKNIEITYYNENVLLSPTQYSNVPKNSNILLFTGNLASANQVIQRGIFFVPTDDYTFKFKFTNITQTKLTLYINEDEVFASEVDDFTIVNSPANAFPHSFVTLTLNRGYHKFKFSFEKRSPKSAYDILVDKLSNSAYIEWVSNSTPNIGGGSGASIGFILPSQYIIDKDLQNVKFVVGKSGKGNIPDPIKKTLVYSFNITNTTPSKEMQFVLNGNQASGIDYSIISNASVANGGTVKSDNNVITVETDGWDNTLYYEVLKKPNSSDAECKIKFIFPKTQQNTVEIYQTVNSSIDSGGNTYMITGSSTTPQYSFLGMIAGGGESINMDSSGIPTYDNYGTASILDTSYEGELFTTTGTFTGKIQRDYYNIFQNPKPYYLPQSILDMQQRQEFTLNPNIFAGNYGNNIPIGYNDAINGEPGSYTSDNPVGGPSVDLSVSDVFFKKYGRGGDNTNLNGMRGNYVITGSNLLYEIYLNGSSIYNVDQIT